MTSSQSPEPLLASEVLRALINDEQSNKVTVGMTSNDAVATTVVHYFTDRMSEQELGEFKSRMYRIFGERARTVEYRPRLSGKPALPKITHSQLREFLKTDNPDMGCGFTLSGPVVYYHSAFTLPEQLQLVRDRLQEQFKESASFVQFKDLDDTETEVATSSRRLSSVQLNSALRPDIEFKSNRNCCTLL
jgi:hypothetical protein